MILEDKLLCSWGISSSMLLHQADARAMLSVLHTQTQLLLEGSENRAAPTSRCSPREPLRAGDVLLAQHLSWVALLCPAGAFLNR